MAKRTQNEPKSYEDAERELTDLIAQIEAGEVTLEDSLVKYERGRYLLEFCRQVLDKAEKQIEVLSADMQGNVTSQTKDRPIDAPDGADDADDATA